MKKHLSVMDFKSNKSDGNGAWLRVNEFNRMIDFGVITLNLEKWEEYMDTPMPELSARRRQTDEEVIREISPDISDEEMKIRLQFMRGARGEW